MSAASHPSFLQGFVGGAIAAATYTAIAVFIYRTYRRQQRSRP